MSGEHAEITLDAGNVDLIDLAGEGEFFGRDEIEVEGGGHVGPIDLISEWRMANSEWRVARALSTDLPYSPLPIRYSPLSPFAS
jgi:hypothetical protein